MTEKKAKKPAAGNKAKAATAAPKQAAEKPAAGNKSAAAKQAPKQAAEKKAQAATAAPKQAPKLQGAPATVGQTFGEMVWLMTQSPIHKQLKLGDLEWLLMPPLMLGQARIFRVGTQPVGLAVWAYLTPEEAEALGEKGRLDAGGWRHGFDVREIITAEKTGKKIDLTPPAVVEGKLELWLVDLVCPFATEENKLAQACLHDLITGPLKDQKLKMHKTDPKTRERTIVEIGG